MGQGYCLVKSVRRCPSPRKRQGLVLLWVSVIEGVLAAEASRMGVLWARDTVWSKAKKVSLAAEASRIRLLWPSVMERVLTARRFFGLEGLWVSFIRGVLTAEASRMGVLWVRDTVWSKA